MEILLVLIGATAVSGAYYFWLRWCELSKQLAETRLQLQDVRELLPELQEQHANEQAEREHFAMLASHLESHCDSLDYERRTLETEVKMRREYAYVCEDCRKHDPAVREARERHLRSVTKR